jgi:hypothetical protein
VEDLNRPVGLCLMALTACEQSLLRAPMCFAHSLDEHLAQVIQSASDLLGN